MFPVNDFKVFKHGLINLLYGFRFSQVNVPNETTFLMPLNQTKLKFVLSTSTAFTLSLFAYISIQYSG